MMHWRSTATLAALCALAATAVPGASRAGQPDDPREIYVNVSKTKFFFPAAVGAKVNGLVAREGKKIEMGFVNDYRFFKSLQPGFDVPGAIREALTCLPGEDSQHCRPVVLIEGDAATLPEDVSPHRSHAKIWIEYWQESLQITVILQEWTDGTRDRRGIMLSFHEPAAPSIGASPLPGFEGGRPSKREQAARDYWFAGSPSRAETALRRTLAESRELMAIANLPRAENPLLDDARWNALPTVQSLGPSRCGRHCQHHVLKATEDRIWFFPTVTAEDRQVRSVPRTYFTR